MSAPISFTDSEHEALSRIDQLEKAISKTVREIATINRNILSDKAKRDRLLARKQTFERRIRAALEIVDTAKNAERAEGS